MRMDRRAGLLSGSKPTFAELLSDISFLKFGGGGSQSNTSLSISLTGIDTSIPFYVIYSCGTLQFIKVDGSTVTSLKSIGTANTPTISSNSLVFSGKYGHAAALVRFPSYAAGVVDSVLSYQDGTIIANRLSSIRSEVTVSASQISSNKIYFAAYARYGNSQLAGLSFSAGNAIDMGLFSVDDYTGIQEYSCLYPITTDTINLTTAETYDAINCTMGAVVELT